MGQISDSLVHPLKLVKIKNPFGIHYTNTQNTTGMGCAFLFSKKNTRFMTTFLFLSTNQSSTGSILMIHDLELECTEESGERKY